MTDTIPNDDIPPQIDRELTTGAVLIAVQRLQVAGIIEFPSTSTVRIDADAIKQAIMKLAADGGKLHADQAKFPLAILCLRAGLLPDETQAAVWPQQISTYLHGKPLIDL